MTDNGLKDELHSNGHIMVLAINNGDCCFVTVFSMVYPFADLICIAIRTDFRGQVSNRLLTTWNSSENRNIRRDRSDYMVHVQ